MLKPQFDNIPAELTLVDRWVCWGGGKRPFSPSTGRPASIKKASDWSKFHTAKATYTRGGFDGVGLVLTGDGLVGIDIDKCVTSNGEPEPAAIDLLHDMGVGYSELSPSGTGLRGFGYAEPLRSGRRGEYRGLNLELYSEGRYLTVTGHRLPGFAGEIVELNGFFDFAKQIGANEGIDSVNQSISTSVNQYICSSVQSVQSVHLHQYPPSVIPTEEGHRHKKLFRLACWLKRLEPNATPIRQTEVVHDWFTNFNEAIGTKDFDITRAEFLAAFKSVDLSRMDGQLAEVVCNPPDLPDWLSHTGLGDNALTLLRICWGLQLLDTTRPFFISARKAGELLNVAFPLGARYLSLFVNMGWLELVEKGAGTKASRYLFRMPGV